MSNSGDFDSSPGLDASSAPGLDTGHIGAIIGAHLATKDSLADPGPSPTRWVNKLPRKTIGETMGKPIENVVSCGLIGMIYQDNTRILMEISYTLFLLRSC